MKTKKIPLPNNKFVTVDEDMFDKLSKHRWCCNTRGYVFRWEKNPENGKYKPLYMQKEILPTKKGELVYISDGNLLNLTRENLIATTRSNLSHHVRKRTNQSKYMGVYFNKATGKYSTYITFEGQPFYLGCLSNERDAALVRDFYSRKYYGDTAHINIKDSRLKNQDEVNRLLIASSSKKTKYYGVSKANKSLYRARLRYGGVNYNCGLYKTDTEAAKARDAKVIELGLNLKKMNFLSVK